jgi:hypothetical protein
VRIEPTFKAAQAKEDLIEEGEHEPLGWLRPINSNAMPIRMWVDEPSEERSLSARQRHLVT